MSGSTPRWRSQRSGRLLQSRARSVPSPRATRPARGAIEQRGELQIAVAVRAGDRRAARERTRARSSAMTVLLELLARSSRCSEESRRRTPRVARRARSSSVQQLPNGCASALVVELHGQTDDVVTLLGEQAAATDESTPPDMATTMRTDYVAAFTACAVIPYGARDRLRSFSTSPGAPRSTRSISVSVLAAPRLKRIEFCVRCAAKPHGLQHVRRLQRPGRTGGSGRDRDALQIQRDQQRLGLDAIEADVRRVRHARRRRPVDRGAGTPRSTPASRRSRSAASRAASSAILPRASRAATPRPTMPATFSVPARRLRSCLPPVISGAAAAPRRIQSAPTPLGP